MRVGLVLLVGCGRIAFDARSDTATGDTPLGAWSPPMPVTFNSALGDDDPSLTADQLQIFFASSRLGGVGGEDIWFATRNDVSEPFGTPVNVTELNSDEFEATPKLSLGGLTLYFASQRPGMGDSDFWMSTRATLTSPWSVPVTITELNTIAKDESLMVMENGIVAYFDSSRIGGAVDKIFHTTRVDTSSTWSVPAKVAELDGPGEEEGPYVIGDVMYLAINNGAGFDVYTTARPTAGSPFGTPDIVEELRTASHDDDPWVSADQRTMYFA